MDAAGVCCCQLSALLSMLTSRQGEGEEPWTTDSGAAGCAFLAKIALNKHNFLCFFFWGVLFLKKEKLVQARFKKNSIKVAMHYFP